MADFSDRHKTPRVYASGANKRKIAEEKMKKDSENLAKIPKLQTFFSNIIEPVISKDPPLISIHAADQEIVPNSDNEITVDTGTPTKECVNDEEEKYGENCTSANVDGFINDIGLWPEVSSQEMIDYWAKTGSSNLQHCDEKLFEESSKLLKNVNSTGTKVIRKCTPSLFKRKNQNNELINRFWFCFSPTTVKIYCYVCKLTATQKSQLCAEGFDDWKHASTRVVEHENTKNHLEAIAILAKSRILTGRIDTYVEKQATDQAKYWKYVLQRVVSTLKFLAERGLAIRGDDEIIGSPKNGNFLGILELIAEYDSFLATHLKEKGNKGSGHVNYLSSTICEELIILMGHKVLSEIVTRLKRSKYYSVSVDSTPDEAHIDQLTVVVRFMEGCAPKERFLTFLPNRGHTGSAMASALVEFLDSHKIDIKDCRGQSYDNAANMAGKYKGMQTLILEKNPLSVFIPCCGHSLNLVGKVAANSCPFAVHFFDFIQNLYVFFTASTERYTIMINQLSKKKVKFYTPKNLSDTRWSSRADATKALVNGCGELKDALLEISQNEEQKDIVKIEANKLLEKMCSIEIALYAIFWNDILERFNATNKLLQDPTMDLHTAVAALTSLKSFVEAKREKFDNYEIMAQALSGSEDYTRTRLKKINVRLNPLDSRTSQDVILSPREKFRVECFIPVVDQLSVSLADRLRAYETACSQFGFLNHLEDLSESELHAVAAKLVEIYKEDLEPNLGNELIQFVSLIKAVDHDPGDSEAKEMVYYRILVKNNISAAFPNVEIALRLYLVLMIANCTGERSFSKLKLIKNRLRTTTGQSRLSCLSLMSIESDILRELDFEDIIHEFTAKCTRKVAIV